MAQLPAVHTVEKARNGDPHAIDAVLGGVRPVVAAFFAARIGRGPDAEDLTQNTLVRLNRGLSDLNDPSSLKAFTMRAAVFELQDYYRGRGRTREQLFDPHDAPHAAEAAAAVGTEIDLDRALESITPHARRILELRAYGYRYEEIAEMVGSTNAAVKMQVKRALDHLREIVLVMLLGLPLAAWLMRSG
jgi:RNA polymerase sigma-70 factor, ECF subfamily